MTASSTGRRRAVSCRASKPAASITAGIVPASCPRIPARMAACVSWSGRPISIDSENRSSWLSGRSKVPICSDGFCVAMTRNGCGNARVSRSMVTARSSIACSRADCVFDGARFSSSASSSWVKTGPSRMAKLPLSRLKTDRPVISAGNRSFVHCTRWKSRPIACASAADKAVLPLPGTSSIRRCPSATRQVSAVSIAMRRPRTAVDTASAMAASCAAACTGSTPPAALFLSSFLVTFAAINYTRFL